MANLALTRQLMVEQHVRRRGITNLDLIEAMREIPREAFLDAELQPHAYEDAPLAIGQGQTISQPYLVALMIEKAEVVPASKVLDVGTGSGYAAAVMSRMAADVYAIERLAGLAETARLRFSRLGFAEIKLRIGDGTGGWPEAAPFDAIIVAAAGPAIPQSLKQQLVIGGRLVMPVGTKGDQRLLRVIRMSAETFEEEDLGAVEFVPLIGDEGWPQAVHETRWQEAFPAAKLHTHIAKVAEPLPDLDDPAFAAAFDRFGSKRIVLLGEASHGTAEFYRARAAITRRLIERHGFNIVAVEADWPDAAAINRHVRGHEPSPLKEPFGRFPVWMWRNREVVDFVQWMRGYNAQTNAPERKAGFYGLDLYNMSGSIAAVLEYLAEVDPEAAKLARKRYGCLTPWQDDPATYGRSALSKGYVRCEEAVVAQCRELLERTHGASLDEEEERLDAVQNARLVAAAERYYRVMYQGGPQAWNLRDNHMFETLDQLLDAHGPGSKAIVWAHNSHIGDARHTDMAMRDEINLGQLCRQRFGSDAALIGFGTHGGKVAAASDWNAPMEIKTLRPALKDSYEELFHATGRARFLLDLAEDDHLRERLREPRLERFIGVIYRPETERFSHYMYASLPQQFDAFVWFDETHPVTPLEHNSKMTGIAETLPSGH